MKWEKEDRLQYAQNVEKTISQMDKLLYKTKDPEKLILELLVMAMDFYDGDWAGILEADLTMKRWSASWCITVEQAV